MWAVDESGPWLSRSGVCIGTQYNILFNTIRFSGINGADRSLARQKIISDMCSMGIKFLSSNFGWWYILRTYI